MIKIFKWHYLIHFSGWVIFHCIYAPHLYPFLWWWTFRLLHVLAIVNNSAMNIGLHASFWISYSTDTCLGEGLLDHMVALFLVFWGNSILFFIVALPTYIHSLFSTPSPAFIVVFFDDGHSDRCEMILHYSFDLHFSTNISTKKCTVFICGI